MIISQILDTKWAVPTLVGISGVTAGFVTGYFVGRKAVPQEVIHYDITNIHNDEKDEPNIMYDAEHEALLSEGDKEFSDEEEEVGPVVLEHIVEETHIESINIFAPSLAAWDEEAEAASRVAGEPYIIHRDVFIENENDWTQNTVTYYVGDDIMADEMETPVYAYAKLMGPLHFGYGSEDPSVVYIRNEKERREWEVIKHTGRYEVEVLGHTIEHEYEEADLQHSNHRKFRDD